MAKVTSRKVVLTSFFVDLLDIVVNLVVSLLTGSVVMLAELVQGISDLIASGLLLIGLARSRKESYFWAFASVIIMLLVASTLSFYFGLKRFVNPIEIENIFIAYIALGIGAVSNTYAFLLSARRILHGKSTKELIKEFRASELIMTKNTFVLDLMGMSAAFVGLMALVLYQILGDPRFDGLGAMGIGVVLGLLSIGLGIDIYRMQKKKLLDEGL